MTYAEFINNNNKALQSIYSADEARYITNLILEEITGYAKHQLRQILDTEISSFIQLKLEDIKAQLLQNKPVQYILGHTYFYGMKFLVNRSVLIPRPETEELVEWVISAYKNKSQALQILDIGTGSGCIPVALKKYLPETNVSSIDISKEALQLANENALLNKVKITFRQLDFLDETSWQQLTQYNIIASNPPYIPIHEKLAMDKNVTAWEPTLALFVGDNDPLLFYKKIADFGKMHLQKDGVVFIEIHQQYAGAVQKIFTEKGYTTELRKDINGNDRMVKATDNKE